jgi:hypothetical protein
MIQITSSSGPFLNSHLAYQAVAALGRAEAMGLLPPKERIETLDLPALRNMLKHMQRAGIGRTIHAVVAAQLTDNTQELTHLLQQLNTALEESPAPKYERKHLSGILGMDLLARLVGISPASLRRYQGAARTTPDRIAARLHFLSMVAGDLSGAYNEMGVRQWFDRKRAQLDGRTPTELLKGDWSPDTPGPVQVRGLARALTASPAV